MTYTCTKCQEIAVINLGTEEKPDYRCILHSEWPEYIIKDKLTEGEAGRIRARMPIKRRG